MDNKHRFAPFLDQLEPIKPLKPSYQRFLLWYTLSLGAILTIMISIQPFRPNFWNQMGWNQFTLETIFSLMATLSVGFWLQLSIIPGRLRSPKPLLVTFLPWLLFLGFLYYSYSFEPSLAPSMIGKRPTCRFEVFFLSWLPLGFFYITMKRGYFHPGRYFRIGIALGCISLPVGLMQVGCMYIPWHVIMHHLLPGLLVGMIIYFISKWIFRFQ